jgi:hypothetical protein
MGFRNIPNDKHSSQGVLSDPWLQKAVDEVDVRWVLILRPFLKVLGHKDDVVRQPTNFTEVSLVARLSEILLAS